MRGHYDFTDARRPRVPWPWMSRTSHLKVVAAARWALEHTLHDLAIAEDALEAERQWRLTSLPALLAAEARAVKAEAAVAEALVAVERGRESVEWASEEVATARRVLEKVHAECARHRGQLLDTEARANKAEARVAELEVAVTRELTTQFPELRPPRIPSAAAVRAAFHQSTNEERP